MYGDRQSSGFRVQGAGRRKCSCRRGFSLIEVLVATTILIIIVLMVSMVFQQSSGAYLGGTRRVGNQAMLRDVIGLIAREMVTAVDGRDYPLVDGPTGWSANKAGVFESKQVAFISLSGTPDGSTVPPRRVPQLIEYDARGGAVKRTLYNLEYKDHKWYAEIAPGQPTTINQDLVASDAIFTVVKDANDPDGLPKRVDVEAQLVTIGAEALISGRSAGPDGQFDPPNKFKDDVLAGASAR
ncbi:MAG: prepilin-type N-terminal cleavage/methylation domain-containing protein [Kiritimatiellae bacterium]|nr:prepilin-type N-terminal cleavage/methylation domain-containing protein [Kiritimatiellia bacterium]